MLGLITGLWVAVETLGLSLVSTIILFFTWNNLANIYFNFLPDIWKNLPFWHIFGLILIVKIIGSLIPKIINVSQSNKN
ncbi:hypothetical protein LCGC14_2254250 [marine sediment metagenome]|uniref:Uncharacterized protein n=1 Tax=marine sediment metagenome TaxID=412755 RepID=A0A0F9FE42_9ZZZZ